MKRPLHIWIIFGLCVAVVLAAVGWISFTALKLDREARQHATLEENVRLALWRMESALSPLITQESARPYFSYSPFHAAERAYTRMFAEIEPGEVLVPSPLLTHPSPYILLHFQYGPNGELTSPQVPTGNMQDNAEAVYTTHEQIEASAARLAALKIILDRGKLMAGLPQEVPQPVQMARVPAHAQTGGAGALSDEQSLRNDAEWQARNVGQIVLRANVDRNISTRSLNVREGAMKPLWIGSALVLARRVAVNGQDYVQGCWLDWQAIRKWLVGSIKDLLPAAALELVASEAGYEAGRMLAALPVKLVPGEIAASPAGYISPVRLSLFIAWGCMLVATIAVGALLLGAVSLSERRGAFVSAVTHELRTPLTTLRMYTEMLADGIVSGEEKTRRYLNTLSAEAERLGHLVENVLAYARLEARSAVPRTFLLWLRGARKRQSAAGRVETVTLRELIGRVKDRLAQRAEQGGMKLVVEPEGEILSVKARADASAVEHILFNLVDNACKYAASASNRCVHLEAGHKGKTVSLRVRDHGPGIARRDARRLFRPFSKSAQEAANRAPGIGLGLALSRRLARSVGGDLRLDEDASEGASFLLTLPMDDSGSSPA